jgi:predicted metal-dependent phosphoesterase TrpH
MTGQPNRSQYSLCATSDLAVLRSVFEQVDAHSCPHRYNFHMHTICSDGRLEPAELIKQAVDIGLADMAITDHHSVEGYLLAVPLLAQYDAAAQPRLWIGTEITSYIGNIDIHILGYGFDPEHPQLAPYLQGYEADRDFTVVEKVIAAIQAAGGLAVLAHPSRYRRSAEDIVEVVAALGIDGLETFYSYKNTDPWTPTPGETKRVQALAQRYGLFSTCGTDTHGANLRIRR